MPTISQLLFLELVNKSLFPWSADILLRMTDKRNRETLSIGSVKRGKVKYGDGEIPTMQKAVFLRGLEKSLSEEVVFVQGTLDYFCRLDS